MMYLVLVWIWKFFMHQHFCNLFQDIQDLLLSWAEHLKEASAIFVRAPSYNKTIFFGGRMAPLDKKDPRIRTLPFATRRATFREVQRVHEVLSTIQIYGKLNYILGIITCLLIVAQPGYNQYCRQNILMQGKTQTCLQSSVHLRRHGKKLSNVQNK